MTLITTLLVEIIIIYFLLKGDMCVYYICSFIDETHVVTSADRNAKKVSPATEAFSWA